VPGIVDAGVLLDAADPDQRLPEALRDALVEHEGELYDGV
jgi:hypothetical protein